jgi:D-serine deaminase-like pyridoxal phosphate-dependent protein
MGVALIAVDGYKVAMPDGLETPAMLLFRDVMDHNLRSACELVGGGQNLMVHVKTHKSADVTRRQIAHGIDGFKCATLKELEMVLEAGALKAILAYPQCQESTLRPGCAPSTGMDSRHRQLF